ncbi:MAG: hypothetical protein J5846_11195 [Desulfovibrio sp.]|nr:hypothetical protein [Desulfovibrio sp.]
MVMIILKKASRKEFVKSQDARSFFRKAKEKSAGIYPARQNVPKNWQKAWLALSQGPWQIRFLWSFGKSPVFVKDNDISVHSSLSRDKAKTGSR